MLAVRGQALRLRRVRGSLQHLKAELIVATSRHSILPAQWHALLPASEKLLARHRHALSVVAVRARSQLQDAEGVPIERFDRGGWGPQRVVAPAAGPYHIIPDATCVVPGPGGGLRCVALVVVVMPGEDDLRVVVIQRLPQRLGERVIAVMAEAEAGVMPVGQGAARGMGGQVLAKLRLLRRTGATAPRLVAVGVEDHDVPAPQFIAVEALRGIAHR
jgi:hypothetical protein